MRKDNSVLNDLEQKVLIESVGKVNEGTVTGAKQLVSPNFNDRPNGEVISLLVIHNISLPPRQFNTSCVEDFFLNTLDIKRDPFFEQIAELKVSAHLFIKRTGDITQFVNLNHRAWHAGISCFKERENCNDFSIGIEMEGTDDLPYEAVQYQVLAYLSCLIERQYPAINTDSTVGHCDIAPGRKTDPGESFDWQYYEKLKRFMSDKLAF